MQVIRSGADAGNAVRHRDICRCYSALATLKVGSYYWGKNPGICFIPHILTSRSSDLAAGRLRNKWSQNIESIESAAEWDNFSFCMIAKLLIQITTIPFIGTVITVWYSVAVSTLFNAIRCFVATDANSFGVSFESILFNDKKITENIQSDILTLINRPRKCDCPTWMMGPIEPKAPDRCGWLVFAEIYIIFLRN